MSSLFFDASQFGLRLSCPEVKAEEVPKAEEATEAKATDAPESQEVKAADASEEPKATEAGQSVVLSNWLQLCSSCRLLRRGLPKGRARVRAKDR